MGIEYNTTLFFIRAAVTAVLVLPLSVLIYAKLDKLERDYATLLREASVLSLQASTDPLTGVLNRRSFEQQFNLAMKRLGKGHFIVADVDYLKTINDKHGHLAGDDAIMATATALRRVLGDASLIARIGGDEFCAFLPVGASSDFRNMTGRINASATEEFHRRSGLNSLNLTISIGMQECSSGADFRAMIRNTDSDLYRKKKARQA